VPSTSETKRKSSGSGSAPKRAKIDAVVVRRAVSFAVTPPWPSSSLSADLNSTITNVRLERTALRALATEMVATIEKRAEEATARLNDAIVRLERRLEKMPASAVDLGASEGGGDDESAGEGDDDDA
jgi:hypothetical protein